MVDEAPGPAIGRMRGLNACATRTGTFAILALDHRQNLRRELAPGDPESVGWAEMVEFKRAVLRALGDRASAVLLDPEIGIPAAVGAGSPGRTGLVVAIEATGYLGSAHDRRSRQLDGWSVEQAQRAGANAAKVLVYYHPDAPGASAQEEFLAGVVDNCAAHDLALFVEPITFSIDPAEPRLAGEARRRVIIETARRLTAIGGDVLKVEFPYDASVTDAAQWDDACRELAATSRLPWVLLSAGIDDATFERQVACAAEAGASGILVGRSVWAPAATLAAPERDAWLASEGRRRLDRLVEMVTSSARPWHEAAGAPSPGLELQEGWFRNS